MNHTRNLCLLHGTLDVCIHSATEVPNKDLFSESLRQCFTAFDTCKNVIRTSITTRIHEKIMSDPYVCIVLGNATVGRTHVIPNTADPCWEEHFEIPVAHFVEEIEFQVKDNDIIGADYIASVKIPATTVVSAEIKREAHDLTNEDGTPCRNGAQLTLSLKYRPVEQDPSHFRVAPDFGGVPNTYFSLSRGSLTLYQDAHVPDGLLPDIDLEDGIRFQHNKCWDDIYNAIKDARSLVYIAGWSIDARVRLVRHSSESPSETLGELLKIKAEDKSVRVLVLVWDDQTSYAVLQNPGVMNTHDEKTRKYFKHSNVHCLLAPRRAHKRISWFKKKMVENFFSHHQKLVLVDTTCPVGGRHLVAFLGGLDLSKGRYDTPEHSLFTHLKTTFKEDRYNPTLAGAVSEGPRQPWHDLHCRIEGCAAYDVLESFEQYWRKSAKCQRPISKLKSSIRGHKSSLVNRLKSCHCADDNSLVSAHTWRIQVFRSIDSGSAAGFPKTPREIQHANLVSGKNIAIDMSIHKAYIEAIRSAQHFIYIENQYFIGSSFNWSSNKRAGSNHLIPIEIALKIANKIKTGEEFAVYIVIPMWPEGDPNSLPIQKLLYFQTQTIEMMYDIIAKALDEKNLNAQYHPTDFLNFFCLGNREKEAEADQNQTRDYIQARRFMIYVHSKGMIVDDEYLIIGSANINQRSMAGSRDTEIAIGAYQPNHCWATRKRAPKGQIYGYRMSLWLEHMGHLDDSFQQPWTPACVKKIQELAKQNWASYTSRDDESMKGHLMPYPIKVNASGKVESLPDFEVFPDVKGRILGANSEGIPDSLVA